MLTNCNKVFMENYNYNYNVLFYTKMHLLSTVALRNLRRIKDETWKSDLFSLLGQHRFIHCYSSDGSGVLVIKNITLKIFPWLCRHLAISIYFAGPLRCGDSEVKL